MLGVPVRTLALGLALAIVASLFAAVVAFGSKGGDSFVGVPTASSGEAADGGLFNNPRDIAVNQTGAGGVDPGTVYVVDQSNHRIQRLDADGNFELTWGRDVVTAGAANDVGTTAFEVCDVTHPTTPNTAANCKGGTTGSLGGLLNNPAGVAVDQDTGDVFVTDRGNFRVQQFEADGTFVRAWGWDVIANGSPSDATNVTTFQVCTVAADCKAGTTGAGEGQFGSGTSNWRLDVSPGDGDPASGKVVVADPGSGSTGNRRIQIFELADLATGAAPTVDDGEIVGGGAASPFFGGNPQNVAVDAAGIVYGIDVGDVTVKRYDTASGSFLAPISGQRFNELYPGDLAGAFAVPETLEVDPETGNLFVTVNPNIGAAATVIYEFAVPGGGSPSIVDFHMRDAGDQTTNGLGILHSGALDRLYVSASVGTIGQRILILDENGAEPPPSATIALPTGVGAHEATLNGTVNPNGPTGFSTKYHFEYSKDGSTWTAAAAPVDLGDGSADIVVDDSVTGLEANTLYRARLVTTRTFDAGTTISAETTFTTPAVAPEVTTGPVQRRTATTVELTGRINPNNLPTSYHFEYGPSAAYGFKAPIPDGDAGSAGTEAPFVEAIEGLQAGASYHYRLVATNAEGTAFGDDRTFSTRASATPPAGRAYEMVTPADKTNRRTGEFAATEQGLVNPGTPSKDGESLLFRLRYGILDPEAGTDFPHSVDTTIVRRGSDGWAGESVTNVVSPRGATGSLESLQAVSADLDTLAWHHAAELFQSGSSFSTKLMGDTGGLDGSGWYEWVMAPPLGATIDSFTDDAALIDDEGARMVRWGQYRGLLGPDDPSHPDYPNPENPGHSADAFTQTSGSAIYRQEPVGSGPRHLVNECTGTGSTATLIPSRNDNGTVPGPASALGNVTFTAGSAEVTVNSMLVGTFGVGHRVVAVDPALPAGTVPANTFITAVGAGTFTMSAAAGNSATGVVQGQQNSAATNDDFIDAQPCEAGSVTSPRGAAVGAGGADSGSPSIYGPVATAMSRDGSRVFFTSPDPRVTAGVPVTCGTGSFRLTDCPPQLFVRQYDADGDATVRWISRSEVDGQAIGLMGAGAIFQGASADGRYVYFKTNAPLVEDDPNGGAITPGGVTTGTASPSSWDIYRYDLTANTSADPADGALMRISGGPSGTADPNTNPVPSDSTVGSGSSVRYVSDDGARVYFVTGAPIGAADDPWNEGPSGTEPGTASSTRNLYVFDATESGEARWRFIAQIPYSVEGGVLSDVANCAGSGSESGYANVFSSTSNVNHQREAVNCVRGTRDGSAIAFETPGRLTEDDTDSASDIYLYDERSHELTRITTPPLGSAPYACDHDPLDRPVAFCNGDFGFPSPPGAPSRPAGQERVGLDGRHHDNLAIDESGELSVYFESRVPLVPEDTNGNHMDTYEWRAGELSLISPGKTSDDAWYSGNSADGQDVFFFTSQRIDPREIDDGDLDVYDARVGGGFPPPPPRPQGCDSLADGCQGPGGGPPLAGDPQTDRPGGGNATPDRRARLRAVRPGRRALRRAARTGVIRLRVRTNTAGRVSATARARVKVGRRSRTIVVARRSIRVGKPGARVLRLRLKKSARRHLRTGRPLRVRLRVAQADAEPRRVKVVLRRAGR